MGLRLVGGSYKGRTRSLYSPDGEKWYEDSDYKTPADMSRYRTSDYWLPFFALIIGTILLVRMFIILFT